MRNLFWWLPVSLTHKSSICRPIRIEQSLKKLLIGSQSGIQLRHQCNKFSFRWVLSLISDWPYHRCDFNCVFLANYKWNNRISLRFYFLFNDTKGVIKLTKSLLGSQQDWLSLFLWSRAEPCLQGWNTVSRRNKVKFFISWHSYLQTINFYEKET